MSDDDIKKLFEQNGVSFVERLYGLVSTKTITLACLVKVVREAIEMEKAPAAKRGA